MRDDDITELISDRVRQRRSELGWSQEELGNRCGLHRTYVGAIERGEKHVTVITLNKLAAAMQVPLVFFLQR